MRHKILGYLLSVNPWDIPKPSLSFLWICSPTKPPGSSWNLRQPMGCLVPRWYLHHRVLPAIRRQPGGPRQAWQGSLCCSWPAMGNRERPAPFCSRTGRKYRHARTSSNPGVLLRGQICFQAALSVSVLSLRQGALKRSTPALSAEENSFRWRTNGRQQQIARHESCLQENSLKYSSDNLQSLRRCRDVVINNTCLNPGRKLNFRRDPSLLYCMLVGIEGWGLTSPWLLWSQVRSPARKAGCSVHGLYAATLQHEKIVAEGCL